MIIVSQDKLKLFNFDNASLIQIMSKVEIWIDAKNSCNRLGIYNTEERAKEVLQEIISFYSFSECKNRAFRMPEN